MSMTGLQIGFRKMLSFSRISCEVKERVKIFERACRRVSCYRAKIQRPHQHHLRSRPHQVKLDIAASIRPVFISSEAHRYGLYTRLFTTIRDTFDSCQQQLEQYVKHTHLGSSRSPPLLV